MLGLFEILLGKLEAYQYISPHILLICQKSELLIKNLADTEIRGDVIVKSLENKIAIMYEEAQRTLNSHISATVNDISNIIKSELRKNYSIER